MILRRFLFLSCLMVFHQLTAQTPKCIINTAAFLQEIQMGNIPVDDGGKPLKNGRDTAYFVIIETKGKQLPQWKMAYISGMAYTLSLTDSTKSDKDEMTVTLKRIMKAGMGNKLWRYELVLSDTEKNTHNYKTGQIILEGRCNGHKFIYPIKTVTTLAPELRP